MRRIWIFLTVMSGSVCPAQITKQPEFDQRDKFRASQVEMAIDSDSHTSGMRGAAVNGLLNRFLGTSWSADAKLAAIRAQLKKQDYTGAKTLLSDAGHTVPFEIGRAVTFAGLGDAHAAVAPLCNAARLDMTATLPFVGDLLELNPGEAQCLRDQLRKHAQAPHADSQVLHVYALSLLRTDPPDPKAAEEMLLAAAKTGPKNAQVWLDLGKLQSVPGRESQAIASLEHALAIDPALAQAHYRLAQLYRQTGKPEQAASHLEAWRKYKDTR